MNEALRPLPHVLMIHLSVPAWVTRGALEGNCVFGGPHSYQFLVNFLTPPVRRCLANVLACSLGPDDIRNTIQMCLTGLTSEGSDWLRDIRVTCAEGVHRAHANTE